MKVDYPYVYDTGHDDTITITLPVSYARLLLLLDPASIVWVDGQPTDAEMSELEEGVTTITNGLNGT